jgi:hypothetical protein
VLRQIRATGAKAGLAVRPATPYAAVAPYLPDLDLLLVMTVEPGFGGQAFMPEMMDKVSAARDLRLEEEPVVPDRGGRRHRRRYGPTRRVRRAPTCSWPEMASSGRPIRARPWRV